MDCGPGTLSFIFARIRGLSSNQELLETQTIKKSVCILISDAGGANLGNPQRRLGQRCIGLACGA
jgi:hypothetical protein